MSTRHPPNSSSERQPSATARLPKGRKGRSGKAASRFWRAITAPPFLPVLLSLFLLGTVLLAFAPALRGGFLDFDDDLYVTDNPHVQAGLTWSSIKWAFQTQTACNWHPLTWISHMLDCRMFGLVARGHHFTSILLHGLNTVLLFLLFRQMTGATWRSFFVAALFGLHPLRVESVAWISERKDLVSAFFFFLALAAYARYARTKVPAVAGANRAAEKGHSKFPKDSALFYGISLTLFALGLMSKPMLVTFPFVLLLLDWWPLRRLETNEPGTRRILAEKAPFFLLTAASCAVTYLVQKHGGAVLSAHQLPVAVRLDNALISVCRYLGKIFWPSKLALFYPLPAHWPGAAVILAWFCVIALCGLALVLRPRLPFWTVGWFWFLGMLVPVLGLVQVGLQAMADRYTYLPSIGVALLVVWTACELRALGTRIPAMLAIAGAGVVVVCGLLTRQQAGYWRETDLLWRHTIDVTRDNGMAELNLGLALKHKGLMSEAGQHFLEAVRCRPLDAEGHGNLGNFLMWKGRIEESIREYEFALRLKPDSFEVHHNLGIALSRARRFDEGIVQFQQALRLRPDSAITEFYLAMALAEKGERVLAIMHLETAIKLKPRFTAAQQQLQRLKVPGS